MKAAPVEKPPKNIVVDQMIWNETLKAEARHHGVNRNTEFNFNPKNGKTFRLCFTVCVHVFLVTVLTQAPNPRVYDSRKPAVNEGIEFNAHRVAQAFKAEAVNRQIHSTSLNPRQKCKAPQT